MKKITSLLPLMLLVCFAYAQPDGTWVLNPQPGALAVGPAQGDGSWWSSDGGTVTQRACLFDDQFVFDASGSFMNVQQNDTWLETWQGADPEQCGMPVAPHDGSANGTATWAYDAGMGTLTINGTGAHVGLAKAVNGAELTDPANAPTSVTYLVSFPDGNTMITDIETAAGVWWRFVFTRYTPPVQFVLEGTWELAPATGSLAVGPSQGSSAWWSNSMADVTTRDCHFDDKIVFNSGGSFENIMSGATWIEGWQGGADACGAPVAPHDGSGNSTATWAYDAAMGTLTLNGVGAHAGLAKAVNGAELADPATAPASITYLISHTPDAQTMFLDIEVGGGAWWRFVYNKVAEDCMAPQNVQHGTFLPGGCLIVWDEDPNATKYDVLYREKGTTAWNRATTANNSRTLNFLDPTKVYQYRVRSYCGYWGVSNATGIREFNMNNAPTLAQTRLMQLDNSSEYMEMYPNPVSSELTVEFGTIVPSDVQFTVVDMTGRMIMNQTISEVEGQRIETFDVSNLNQGYYMLIMQSGEDKVVKKFAKL